MSDLNPILIYTLFESSFKVETIKLVIAILMASFALFEIIPKLNQWTVDKKYLPFGGFLSGFFGGLSGHQGALRSAFLIRAGLTKEKFIGTGVVTACLVDLSRIIVYGSHLSAQKINDNFIVLISATLSAFIGAYLGNKLLKKITLKTVQLTVSILLFLISILLGSGLI